MIEFLTSIDGSDVCGTCGDALAEGRYVLSAGSILAFYCSEDCFRLAAHEQKIERRAARRRIAKRLAIGVVAAVAWLTPHQRPLHHGAPRVSPALAAPAVNDVGMAPLPVGWFGPEWPPADLSLLAALGRDSWVHPLAGPYRRMPRTDARVFGAVRPGDRAVECRNGHCGVDLGGEIWGEHVRAVHEGVVDFVQRGPNPDHGGRFVRLSHRNGTVFTWYFHLAAIPRGLERGTTVKGGDVLGLLGDSGVKESAPHLHFAMSMRAWKDGPEKYIDPEPLIALWPLRVPIDGSEIGLVTTTADVAVPLGSALLRAGHKAKSAKEKRAATASARSGRKSAATRETDAIPANEESSSESTADESVPLPERSSERAAEPASESPTDD